MSPRTRYNRIEMPAVALLLSKFQPAAGNTQRVPKVVANDAVECIQRTLLSMQLSLFAEVNIKPKCPVDTCLRLLPRDSPQECLNGLSLGS